MIRRLQLISETLDAIGLGYVAFELMDGAEGDRLRLIDMNDSASTVACMDLRPAMGLPVDESMPSVRAAGLVPIYADVARGGPARQLDPVRLPIAPMEGQVFRITVFPLETNIAGVAFENVTARVDALERIRFQSQLLDAVGQAVASVGLDGRVTYWNEHAERLYGWSVREAVGQRSADLVGPAVEEVHRRAFQGEAVIGEMQVTNRLGEPVIVNTTVSPIRDQMGRVVGCIGTAVDISEQRRAEAAARESNRRMRALIDAIPDMVLRMTPEGKVLEVTRVLDQLPITAGVTICEVAAPRVTRASLERLRTALRDVGEDGALQSAELELLDDGTVRHLEFRLIYAGGGEILGIVSDITDRVALIRAGERRRVGLDLHDQLGQSLTALKLSLETASRSGSAREAEFRAAARRAGKIIGEVRSISLALRETAAPGGLFAALRTAFRIFERDTRVQVRLLTRGDDARLPAAVQHDALRIAQEAITNVARHANVNRASVEVSVEVGHVHIAVADTGQGFDPSALQESGSPGLRAIEERVRAAAGTLNVRSAPGRGTTIEVDLPFTEVFL